MTVWRVLRGLLRTHPGLALLNIALAVLIAGLDLLPGPLTRALFDTLATAAPAGPRAETLIAALLGVALARTVLKTNAVLASDLHQFVAANLLRRSLLARILTRPDPDGGGGATGETLGRIRDDVEQVATFLGLLCYGVSVAVFAGGAATLLVRSDARLAALVFLPLVATVALAQRALGRLARYRAASRAAAGRVTAALGELFEAVGAIQAAGAEAHVAAHFRGLNAARGRLALRDAALTRGLGAAFAHTVGLGTGLVLLFAAGSLRAGTFGVGDFALFAYYLGFVSEFTRFGGGALAGGRQTGIAIARLGPLLRGAPAEALTAPGVTPPGVSPAPAERLVSVAVTGLTYRHPTSGRGIVGVDLRIARGEIVVLAGRIAAGKTTLLRTLLGQLAAESGVVRWNGAPVRDPAAWCVPPRVAYTPQVPRLFSETLGENILLGVAPDAVDLPGVLHAAVLEDDRALLPAGLATPVGPRGVRLSGGQIQRAAVARMLARAADLLVLDDPTSALDAATERLLWARLLARPDRTVLVASNRRAALRAADRIVLLDAGRVAATGTLAELLATSAALRQLWEDEGRETR